MALEKLRITNTTDGYSYDIYPVQSVPDTQRKDAFSIAPPGQSPDQNILLGVSGMQGDIEISASIWDDGSDRSNGTAASTGDFANDTVETVEEQQEWLRDYIHAPEFSVAWELDHLTGNAYSAKPVFIEQLRTPVISRDSPKWKPLSIRLRVGQSVG